MSCCHYGVIKHFKNIIIRRRGEGEGSDKKGEGGNGRGREGRERGVGA